VFRVLEVPNFDITLKSQSQSYIATDGQSISKSWCRAPSGAHDQIFITLWQLWSGFLGAPSLTRGRVCLLHMLLALASVVFLGSESFQTRDHILLSQILDFPFRRLVRLAGSRWRYSNPPPHGSEVEVVKVPHMTLSATFLKITHLHWPHGKHRIPLSQRLCVSAEGVRHKLSVKKHYNTDHIVPKSRSGDPWTRFLIKRLNCKKTLH
jgi:hypothetical protein